MAGLLRAAVLLFVGGLLAGPPAAAETDQRGAPLPPDLPARNVVILNTALWPYLTMDQAPSHIAGASASARRVVETGLLGRIFPRAKSISTSASINGTPLPDIENILAARPDAVLQWAGDNEAAFLAPLDRLGLPTVGMIHMSREEDYFATNRLIGALAGKPERAQLLELLYRQAYADLVRDLPRDAARPRVLYLWQVAPILPVAGASIYSEVIEKVGGENVARRFARDVPVDLEQVLAWNPEVIVMFCCGAANPVDLLVSPLWSHVQAVRDRRVYKVPIGGTRFADMVEGPLFGRWMAELLHPRMERRLRGDMRRIYAQVYGYDLSEAEIDRALQLDRNAGSLGYERFRP